MPKRAAEEAGRLAHESLVTGMRAAEITERIKKIGARTDYQAKRIALTEISKAHTALTRARAADVGSEGYIWRTAHDGGVRQSHKGMEGRFVRWDQKPVLDDMAGHAGEFPFCRCYPEPVIPRNDETKKAFAPFLQTRKQEIDRGEKKLYTHWEKSAGAELVPHVSGQPLYNVGKAVFIPEKLTAYSLDPDHPKGKHKAHVWKAFLGATVNDAKMIEKQIMEALPSLPAHRKTTGGKDTATNQYGTSFNVIVPVTGPNGKTVDVLTAWIYKRDYKEMKKISTRPTLSTIYVKK